MPWLQLGRDYDSTAARLLCVGRESHDSRAKSRGVPVAVATQCNRCMSVSSSGRTRRMSSEWQSVVAWHRGGRSIDTPRSGASSSPRLETRGTVHWRQTDRPTDRQNGGRQLGVLFTAHLTKLTARCAAATAVNVCGLTPMSRM